MGVIVDHLTTGALPLVGRRAAVPLFDQLLGNFNDLISLAVAYIILVSALVMPNMVCHGHEHGIVIDAAGCGFHRNQLRRLALQHQNAGLNTDIGLERVGM